MGEKNHKFDGDLELSFFLTKFNRMDFEILINSNIVFIVQIVSILSLRIR